MSAAVLFFWDWAGAPAAPPPPPPPAPAPQDLGSGGGKSRSQYVPHTQEYWDERERYLRTLYPEEIEPAPPPDNLAGDYEREANRLYEERKQQLEALASERASHVIALRGAPDLATMRSHGARIQELNAKIAELTGKLALSRFMH